MPIPKANENEEDFMGRCMAFPDMQQYDPSQRAAICHSKWDKKKSMKKLTAADIKEQRFMEREASILKLAGAHQEERWISFNTDPENVCPICADLEALDWVPFGLLPKFKQAHSTIGEGNWNCPDSACQCRKGYRRVAGEAPEDIIPLTGDTGDNPLSLYRGFSKSRVLTVMEKIEAMKKKYSNGCCGKH